MTEPSGTTALVRRLLPAPPEVVYDEWLDPSALADWMCPRPARCRGIESDPRVGGRLRLDIEEEGAEFYVTGEYLVLDRPGQLSFTWSCSTWPDPSLSSVVTVLLEPREEGQTLMTIRHTLLPPGLAAQHERGWDAIAGQLAAELAAGRPRPVRGHDIGGQQPQLSHDHECRSGPGQGTGSESAAMTESIRPGKRRSRSSLRSDI